MEGDFRFLNRRGGVPSGAAAFIAIVKEGPAISGKNNFNKKIFRINYEKNYNESARKKS
jgi:hypothetical protein